MQKNKKLLISLIAAVALVALLIGAFFLWKGLSAKPNEGSKAITFEVVLKDGTSKEYEIETEADYLAKALEEEGLIKYDASGLYATIDGVTADWNVDQGWWCISKDGTALTTGMNEQVIADGEHYEATYTVGY